MAVPAKQLLQRLSYTHLALLVEMENPLVRAFYEIECIKGGWSVRELKRQIGSLYFERSGLSKDKEALSRMANEAAEAQTPALVIRDPFIFDFLGILLCTCQNGELVHYALAGMDQQLFVSRYQTQLPDVRELEAFVKSELQLWKKTMHQPGMNPRDRKSADKAAKTPDFSPM